MPHYDLQSVAYQKTSYTLLSASWEATAHPEKDGI